MLQPLDCSLMNARTSTRRRVAQVQAAENQRVIVYGSGASDESQGSLPFAATMATTEQVMEAIQKSVAAAVAETMKQLQSTALGAAAGPKVISMRETVDTVVKRMDKFTKDGFQDKVSLGDVHQG